MSRTIRLLIAYDGGNYLGWQRQRLGMTIQGELEKRLTALCGEPVTLHGAGRTDTGVHALGMVAHFQTTTSIPVLAFSRGLNSMLPGDIRILAAEPAPNHFHSRFSALAKTYRYDFFTGEVIPPYLRLYRAHLHGSIAPNRLHAALQAITGTHDFSSFERAGSRDKNELSGRGAVRTIFAASCFPQLGQEECWSIRITGDGFLRQMVRILAGTLIAIGQAKNPPHAMARILAAQDRTQAGLTAPACGLFLEQIYYAPTPFQT